MIDEVAGESFVYSSRIEGDAKDKVGQEQIHGLLFGDKLSWQSIIYDLMNSERLDAWDIDISLLVNRYLEKVKELEEANFFVSSKVLFAAALLLRIKSEILLNVDLKSLDEILYGKKEEKKYVQERIELDEEVPDLVPRTPLPRFKKVTLNELMAALGNAITTETRRIKRVVVAKQQEYEASLVLPRKTINIQSKINEAYHRLREIFKNKDERVPFSEFGGNTSEEKISNFIPLLHLDTQHKIWIEQEGHLDEIWILLKSIYEEKNYETLEQMRKEVEEDTEEWEKLRNSVKKLEEEGL